MIRQLLSAVFAAWILLFTVAYAQDSNVAIDYAAWEQAATQAETIIADGTANEARLNAIRQQMVDWRSQFQQGQNANASRIATLKDQISALGPAPAEGETEPEEIAARRAALNEQLTKLQAPRLTAVEAFSRADAIIRDIDQQLADRQATVLAQLSPSPLLPASWQTTATELGELGSGIVNETTALAEQRGGWAELKQRLPVALGYLGLAIILLSYGRRWIESLPSKLSARASEHSRAVVAFLVSLGQIAVPMLGIFLLITALDSTGLFGEWTRPFLIALPAAGVILFGGRWLSRQLFPRKAIAYATLNMPDGRRRVARNSTNLLALIFAVHHVAAKAFLPMSGLYESMGASAEHIPMQFDEAAASVLHFIIILITAVLLFRLGNVLRRLTEWNRGEDIKMRYRVLTIGGMISRILAGLVMIFGAVGFINFANALLWPWVLTLALIGALILLQDFIADIFDMISQGKEGAREGLAPLLIGFVLVILSTPLFMIIWGATRGELADIWGRIQRGISVGGINLSPGSVLTFLVVFSIGYMVTRGVQRGMRRSVLPKTRLDAGGQNAVVSGLGYIGIFLAAVMAITSAGIDLSSLAIVAGALSVGIGFGLQTIVSNFVSGIILLIERPISVGDWIDAAGQQGIVKRISVRSTLVETFDKTEVIVPNSDLISQPVTNWTRANRTGRIIVPIGVAYGTDTRKVERILREIIEDQPLVTIDPAPAVLFRGFGADSMDFEIRAVLSDVSAGVVVTSDVCHEVARRFAEEHIEIPFPQRDIWLRNPEAFRAPDPSAKAAQPEKPQLEKAPENQPRPDARLTFDSDDGDGDGDST